MVNCRPRHPRSCSEKMYASPVTSSHLSIPGKPYRICLTGFKQMQQDHRHKLQLTATFRSSCPSTTETATHIYLRRPKTTPLSPTSKGPYPILERLGKSVIKIKTGTYNNGNIRVELHHWKNCHPMVLPSDTTSATRVPLGRKPAS